jgi:SAM-dependent methyltransferase
MLDNSDKLNILKRYDSRIMNFGVSEETLAIGPIEHQVQRYNVLLEVGIKSGDTVLDIGCGLGGFYNFLIASGIKVKYIGIDINTRYIDECKRRFPEASFFVGEIHQFSDIACDYVVSSSTFNLNLETDNYEFLLRVIGDSYNCAKKGVAIDFLSTYAESKKPGIFYYDPARVFAIARNYTKRICIRHDYPLFEFTLYLFPDFSGWLMK